jgi:hypothetical protein
MIKYIGITQKTANWFLTYPNYLEALKADFRLLLNNNSISSGLIAIGPLRISAFDDQLLIIWNNDYASGTDFEEWGFIRIQSPLGLLDEADMHNEVLERELYVINQRLQGLLLPDDRMIHRSLGKLLGANFTNMHRCLAGRGERARHFCVGWYEGKVASSKGSFHSIICVGPSSDDGYDILTRYIQEAKDILPKLLETANITIAKSKSRPILDVSIFTRIKDLFSSDNLKKGENNLPVESPPELDEGISSDTKYSTLSWTYHDWIEPQSPLSKIQRYVLESDIILKQPIRIIGAAGTGKSLLMQLLSMRRLYSAMEKSEECKVLYLVHNSEMSNSVWNKFETLGAEDFLIGDLPQKLEIKTLFEHCCTELDMDESSIIDKDAYQTKIFQRQVVLECIGDVFSTKEIKPSKSDLFSKVSQNPELLEIFSDLIANEIGVGIKGRDLTTDKKKYINSERPLTRLHGVLSKFEREIVFEIFEKYREQIFEIFGQLDSDDIAISFLSHLRTPLWEMKRKKLGYDYIFVDETQLFNQNERQLFKFLHKKSVSFVPIVIALDQAQELRGSSSAGFGLLGIEDLKNQTLPEVHRCTPAILKLAFFTISRTTDLFGPDFPDFTKSTSTVISENHPLSRPPRIVIRDESTSISRTILKELRELRKNNIRQIGVIIHADRYWNEIVEFLNKQDLPVIVGLKRGEYIDPERPIVYLSKPESIGGQEFDAVICVGLEHGIVPPIVNGHAGLSETLEQQSLREMYLAFTRAKYQLAIINAKHSSPSNIIQQAINNRLIEIQKHDSN